MTTRSDLEASLAVHDPQALKLILDASGVNARGAASPSELASRIVDAMWWSYSTPLGYLADRATFEDIVWHVARKLRVSDRVDRKADAYDQSQQLTHALLGELPDDAIGVAQLDADSQRRLGASWFPTVMLGGGAGSSFAARWGSGKFLGLLRTPVGRLLPLLPAIGPYIGAIKTATSAVHAVAGPLGIGLSVLSFNQALGANYRRLVPLVLSVGALRPRSVDDAQIIDFPGSASPSDPEADEPAAMADVVPSSDPFSDGTDDIDDALESANDDGGFEQAGTDEDASDGDGLDADAVDLGIEDEEPPLSTPSKASTEPTQVLKLAGPPEGEESGSDAVSTDEAGGRVDREGEGLAAHPSDTNGSEGDDSAGDDLL